MADGRPDAATLTGFIVLFVLIGFNVIAVRVSNFELEPFWGATLRYLVATLLLVAGMWARRLAWPSGAGLRASVWFGVLNFGAFFGLMYWALVRVPAGVTAVVLAATPLATYLFAMAFRLERFAWPALVGAVVVIVGVGVIGLEGLARDVPPLRYVAVVLAVLATSLAAIVVKRAPAVHPVTMNAVGMGAGTLLLGAAAFVAGDRAVLPAEPRVQVALVYLILASVTMFVLMVWLIHRWAASSVAYAGVLAPVVTVVAAHFLLGEAITGRFVLGAALIGAGVYWGALRPRGGRIAAAPGAQGTGEGTAGQPARRR